MLGVPKGPAILMDNRAKVNRKEMSHGGGAGDVAPRLPHTYHFLA